MIFCLAFHLLILLFALNLALRRYKQMTASQKCGDVCVAIA